MIINNAILLLFLLPDELVHKTRSGNKNSGRDQLTKNSGEKVENFPLYTTNFPFARKNSSGRK